MGIVEVGARLCPDPDSPPSLLQPADLLNGSAAHADNRVKSPLPLSAHDITALVAPLPAVGAGLLPAVLVGHIRRFRICALGDWEIDQIGKYRPVRLRKLPVLRRLSGEKFLIIIRQILTFCQIVIVLHHQSSRLIRIQPFQAGHGRPKSHGAKLCRLTDIGLQPGQQGGFLQGVNSRHIKDRQKQNKNQDHNRTFFLHIVYKQSYSVCHEKIHSPAFCRQHSVSSAPEPFPVPGGGEKRPPFVVQHGSSHASSLHALLQCHRGVRSCACADRSLFSSSLPPGTVQAGKLCPSFRPSVRLSHGAQNHGRSAPKPKHLSFGGKASPSRLRLAQPHVPVRVSAVFFRAVCLLPPGAGISLSASSASVSGSRPSLWGSQSLKNLKEELLPKS
ncbi:unknown [Clostridium sp. CAG:149]|nr:unknown [Clostridium sp. CAG:149]